ncbi:MAG: cysteine desulfurase family protein, partial [Planctomycetota bacterium]
MADRQRTIYLDNHATTRLDPRVLEAMLPWLTDRYGNAGSVTHEPGREARAAVEAARTTFADAIAAEPREIVFTGGATESANLAILGTAARHATLNPLAASRGHVITIATEHHAVLDPVEHLERRGVAVTRLPVMPQHGAEGVPGRIRLADLAAALRPDTMLVSVLLANNEIGVVQDVAGLAAVARAGGALFHADAAQAGAAVRVAFARDGVDLMSVSGHKMYGPKGIGALLLRRGRPRIAIEPLVYGGGQERGLRSGTVPVPLVVG